MRTTRHILLASALAFLWAGAARADLVVRPTPGAPAGVPAVVPGSGAAHSASQADRCRPIAVNDRVSGESPGTFDASALLGVDRWSALSLSPAATPPREFRELPGLPGSSSLFLSAVLSVGAWHMVRKASHLHWGDLPEWYHPDAPHQIGHSVAFELAPGLFAPLLLDEPVGEGHLLRRWRPDPPICRSASRCLLAVTGPRSPPRRP